MSLSTIYRQRRFGPNTPFARALGAEVRRVRCERGMTQAELGAPLTRSYVSAVELGRAVPSVPALAHIASRLGTEPGSLLPGLATFPERAPARGRTRHGAPAAVAADERPDPLPALPAGPPAAIGAAVKQG